MQAPPLTFRDAQRDDLAKILDIIRAGAAVANQHGTLGAADDTTLATFDFLSNSEQHRLIVVERESAIIGTMQIIYLPDLAGKTSWRAQFESVHIVSEHRGNGFGSQLIKWATDEATRFGAGTIQLTSNKKRSAAHGFYKNLGFANSHEGFKLLVNQNT